MTTIAADSVAILTDLPFLAGLPKDEVTYTLERSIELLDLYTGEEIFRQEEPADRVYYLVQGRVRWQRHLPATELGSPTMGHVLGPGRLIGHYALLYNEPYPMSVEAAEPCQLLKIESTALNRLLYHYPSVRQQMAPGAVIGRLRTMPWLAELGLMEISLLAEEMKTETFAAGAQIYASTDRGEQIYFVDRGQVKLVNPRRPEDIHFLGNGATFGLQPTLHGADTYRNWAQAVYPSRLYSLPRSLLDNVAPYFPGMRQGDSRDQRKRVIEGLRLFSQLEPAVRRQIVGHCGHYLIPQHRLIHLQGEVADSLWILMPGSRARLHVLSSSGAALPSEEVEGPLSFGEGALLLAQPITSTVEAIPHSQWLRLHRQDFLLLEGKVSVDLRSQLDLGPAARQISPGQEERERYPWLESNEALIFNQRRHWVILLRKLLPSLIITAIALVLLTFLGLLGMPPVGLASSSAAVILLTLPVFLWGLVDFLNDYLLVTNQRVVQQDKVLFISERRRAAPLNQIQNIDVNMTLIGNLLGYGTLVIHTASAKGDIIFNFAPNPGAMRIALFEQIRIRKEGMQARTKMEIQNILEERLGIRLDLPSRVYEGQPYSEPPPQRRRWQRLVQRLRRLFDIGGPENWQSEEHLIWRKHWLVLVTKISPPILLCLIGLLTAASGFFPGIQNLLGLFQTIEILAVFIGLSGLIWAGWVFADWRNDTYEISNTSIVDTDKKPLFFAENRREAPLEEIQDIELEIPTPLHYLFNFGNVRVRTAAAEGIFTFDSVPDPRGVSEEVRRRIEVWRTQAEQRRAKERSRELPDWFEIYRRLDVDQAGKKGN